ncbi:peroxiredoxin [Boudabousia marimammalium]|uniref:thioredoxin-dependent peroxiredoxin n=1 Tax=Boudabousia marimammalium TaxID=156892 RepID=A0A1Q5PRT2_9ACTO|nr:peroxiredoxin [Boudabousia marimammalium]OKL50145.1 peroxiredoxin [Boudabousia marimammalium]
MGKLIEGDKAPDFSLDSMQGGINLEDLLKEAQTGLILYFYPRANTPGCTTEACDFRDNLGRLTGLGYTVVGISPDKLAALEKFAADHELPFILASNPEHDVMEAYGAWGEKLNYGKTVVGTIRSTVVISPTGEVSHALYNVRAKGHVDRLTRLLSQD